MSQSWATPARQEQILVQSIGGDHLVIIDAYALTANAMIAICYRSEELDTAPHTFIVIVTVSALPMSTSDALDFKIAFEMAQNDLKTSLHAQKAVNATIPRVTGDVA
jgi:hypothetical protein